MSTMNAHTHVTEWGLGLLLLHKDVILGVAAGDQVALKLMGLHADRIACTGTSGAGYPPNSVINYFNARDTVPTCQRCAVMRDEVLEGCLPKREGL